MAGSASDERAARGRVGAVEGVGARAAPVQPDDRVAGEQVRRHLRGHAGRPAAPSGRWRSRPARAAAGGAASGVRPGTSAMPARTTPSVTVPSAGWAGSSGTVSVPQSARSARSVGTGTSRPAERARACSRSRGRVARPASGTGSGTGAPGGAGGWRRAGRRAPPPAAASTARPCSPRAARRPAGPRGGAHRPSTRRPCHAAPRVQDDRCDRGEGGADRRSRDPGRRLRALQLQPHRHGQRGQVERRAGGGQHLVVQRARAPTRTSASSASQRVTRSAGAAADPTSRARALATPGSVAAWLATASPAAAELTRIVVSAPPFSTTSGRGSGRTDRATHVSPNTASSEAADDRDDPPEQRLGGHGVHHDRVEQRAARPAVAEHAVRKQGDADPGEEQHEPDEHGEPPVAARRARDGRTRPPPHPAVDRGGRLRARAPAPCPCSPSPHALPLLHRHRDARACGAAAARPAAPAPGRRWSRAAPPARRSTPARSPPPAARTP